MGNQKRSELEISHKNFDNNSLFVQGIKTGAFSDHLEFQYLLKIYSRKYEVQDVMRPLYKFGRPVRK